MQTNKPYLPDRKKVMDFSQILEADTWTELAKSTASYVIVGIVSFIAAKYRSIFNYIERNFLFRSSAVESMTMAYDIVWELEKTQKNIDRVAVFRAGNGGSVPSPGRPMKVTMLFNSYDHPKRNQKKKYQDLPVDRDYVKMLKRVFDSQDMPVDLVVEDMELNCLLRNVYKGEGIKFSQVRYLTHTKNYIYFASYASTKDIKGYLDAKEMNAITLSNSRITNLLLTNPLD